MAWADPATRADWVPALVAGIDDRVGRIQPGMVADLVLLALGFLAYLVSRGFAESVGFFERALYARVPAGIVVNGTPPKPGAKRPKPAKRVPVEGNTAAAVLDRVGEVAVPSLERDAGLAEAPCGHVAVDRLVLPCTHEIGLVPDTDVAGVPD